MLKFTPCDCFIEIVDEENTCVGEIYFNTDIDNWCYYPYDELNNNHLQQVMSYMDELHKGELSSHA